MSEPDAFKISEAVIDLWRCYTIERDMAKELEAENARLKAEVERLTNAGDGLHKSMLEIGCNEMADNFQHDAWYGSMKDWKAAKEGKGQP